MINCVTGERGAQRGADTDRAADDSETKIEPPRASRDICDHEWKGNAENCGADAIERLHRNNQIRVAHERKQHPAQGQGHKAEEQRRPPSPRIGHPTDPWRKPCDNELGRTMQAAIKVEAHSLARKVTIPAISGSMAAFASWNSKMQPANINNRRSLNTLRTVAVGAATPVLRGRSAAPMRMRVSAKMAGAASAAVKKNTAWLETR